eukprot:jgi/Galph1/5844/GphlegSOOS_G4415.1
MYWSRLTIRCRLVATNLSQLNFSFRRCSTAVNNNVYLQLPKSAATSTCSSFSSSFSGDSWVFETGRLAPIADASCLAKQNDNTVLATVTRTHPLDAGMLKGFINLQVDYKEEASAGGIIPGTYTRRDSLVSDKEILVARAIDRSLRPLLPQTFTDDLQVTCSVLSAKGNKDTDVLALNAASMALLLSTIPFQIPIGAVRVALVSGQFIVNPSFQELENSELNILYACTKYKTVMLELEAREAPISILQQALKIAHEKARILIQLQERFLKDKQVMKDHISEPKMEQVMLSAVKKYNEDYARIFSPSDNRYLSKIERRQALTQANEKAQKELSNLFGNNNSSEISHYLHQVERDVFRQLVIQSDRNLSKCVRRCDGRYSDELRPLRAEVEVLPVVHGSSIFERGDTQVVCVTTVGPTERALKLQSYAGGAKVNKFMVHYRFPPYCNGQTGNNFSRNRRETGHGALVEKSLRSLIETDNFPYVVRVNAVATGSDGSTSMASVCAASLSLMDAGIPLQKPVAGISIGLVAEGEFPSTQSSVESLFRKHSDAPYYILLTDILGIEDHHGDMDFKITGTGQGFTGCQLDVKLHGIPPYVVLEAFQQASVALEKIVATMNQCLSQRRSDLRPNAPRCSTLYIEPLLRSSLLGVGGYKLRSIVEETGADIQVDDLGKVDIEAPSLESYQNAVKRIHEVIGDLIPGTRFYGKITDIRDYGVMVELFQGREGLVHVSELSDRKILRASELDFQIGQSILVEVIAYDRKRGQVKLSHRKTKSQNSTS